MAGRTEQLPDQSVGAADRGQYLRILRPAPPAPSHHPRLSLRCSGRVPGIVDLQRSGTPSRIPHPDHRGAAPG